MALLRAIVNTSKIVYKTVQGFGDVMKVTVRGDFYHFYDGGTGPYFAGIHEDEPTNWALMKIGTMKMSRLYWFVIPIGTICTLARYNTIGPKVSTPRAVSRTNQNPLTECGIPSDCVAEYECSILQICE